MNDLISRQAAIDALLHHGELENDYTDLYHDGYCDGIYDSCDVLEDLPSAQPERKKGKWEEKEVIHEVEASTAIDEWQSARCSVCGKYHTTPYMYYFDEFNFCPNCGADMRGEEE